MAAQLAFDQPALEGLLAPDYLEVSPVGDVDTREEVIGFYSAEAKAKAKTDLDAIQARYQPEVVAFAQELQAFAVTQGAPAEQMAAVALQIQGIPAKVRTEVEQAAAAPAAPAQPQ